MAARQDRDEAGRFKKGVSGNPGGMPRMPEEQRKALRDLTPDAIALKAKILRDETAPLELRNKVADSVLDRVYGRPKVDCSEDDFGVLNKLDALLEGISKDAVKR